MQLSDRLKYISGFVKSGSTLADIGTDHGFIPIELVKKGIIKKAYAMDINKGPLERAERHIRECGLESQIETRLSDGLAKLKPFEADTVLIAGMGGELIAGILERGKEHLEGVDTLILSPHTEHKVVRQCLEKCGYSITNEGMVKDAGKYYVVIHAEKNKDADNCYPYVRDKNIDEDKYNMYMTYGKILIENRDMVLYEYLVREKDVCEKILYNIKNNSSQNFGEREKEIRKKHEEIQKILDMY